MALFKVRLNCVDYYQAAPTPFDPKLHRNYGPSQKNAPTVPVVRVFGATETGQKVCAHIHGALPYLYLEYQGSLAQDAVSAYITNLRASIDYALAGSYRRNPYDGKSVFVAHISLVKGTPYYGYYVGYKVYLKVYLHNPNHMTRLADLLYQGVIMGKAMQPHESHLQFLLQWMCDYNLYGCAYIDCEKVKFRGPVPEYLQLDSDVHKWHDRSIDPAMITDPEVLPRQSHCSIEVDIMVQDILNRREISVRPLHYDFIERLNTSTSDEKLVHSMAGLWRDETRRRKLKMGLKDPSSSPFPPEVLVSMSADPRNTDKGGWIHEEEYAELIKGLVSEEKADSIENIRFETFVKHRDGEDRIQTALESVEDLFSEKLKDSQSLSDQYAELAEADSIQIAVNAGTEMIDIDNNLESASDAGSSRDNVTTNRKRKAEQLEENNAGEDGEVSRYTNELKPDGAAYATEFQDPLDNAPVPALEVDERANDSAYDTDHVDPESLHVPQDYIDRLNHGGSRSSKRAKLSALDTTISGHEFDRPRSRHVAFEGGNGLSRPSDEQPNPRPTDISYSSSSQRSIKASGLRGANPLSFPVVKNPNDPNTALRLSQRSGFSNSQKSPKTPASKVLSAHTSLDSPTTPWTTTTKQSASFDSNQSTVRISLAIQRLAERSWSSSSGSTSATVLLYGTVPPSCETAMSTMMEEGLPPIIYQDAYYSNEDDVPAKPREYAGREFKLQSTTLPYLPDFDPTGSSLASRGEQQPVLVNPVKESETFQRRAEQCSLQNWEYAQAPPTWEDVNEWLKGSEGREVGTDTVRVKVESPPQQIGALKDERKPESQTGLSQIDGPTQKNKHGFKYSQKQKSTSVQHETQYMSTMSLEVHVNARGNLLPDPAQDEISAIFWSIQTTEQDTEGGGVVEVNRVGILALSKDGDIGTKIAKQTPAEVEEEDNELDLLVRIVGIVRDFDPDILTGYEVHNGSWGYLIERARLEYEYDICDEFSRTIAQSHGRAGKDADPWGFTQTSTIRITGRHMINIWRAMRGELNLLQYTMENVVFHILHKRIPHYTYQDLTHWYTSGKPKDLAKVIDYFISRVQIDLEILEANELIARTSEQARLLGVDFFSVFSRGSQFKVESLMFRIAKPENFILVSPSRKQVGQQNALECLPLVMEPQSNFYNSPLLVLDFQSLYPSVMIAYNYCYSTCLGRIVNWRGRNKMGFTDLQREPRLLELVKNYINIAPNGIMYVKPEMRKSLLAKMLSEILETRVMVKSGMKQDKDDKTLQQLLNNRQLALKLIANVTYGYTSASFSGRMPCSEIADSIVQTGRETLEKAIALIHSVKRWGAEVVYGDTDSLFVYLKGRTKDEAFDIGNEIAKAVTDMNPRPVKLKFEKVYFPCVLLAKKRYVGFKYESKNQKEPDFDAKGIETVRRDGTPAEQKIEEKALKILFRTADLSQVKAYFQAQCTKIMMGRVSIQDFCFAREVKLGTYSDKGPPPPGALISTKRMLADHRAEPQYGERVPYVVITGAPGARLIDRCVAPERLLEDENIELDAEYYISKNLIPPLERIFNLVGANVRQWYDEMPKVRRIRTLTAPSILKTLDAAATGGQRLKMTLESYMKSAACLICRRKISPPLPAPGDPEIPMDTTELLLTSMLCTAHRKNPPRTLYALHMRARQVAEKKDLVDKVCRSCSGQTFDEEIKCDSRDCPVFWTRRRANTKLTATKGTVDDVIDALEKVAFREELEW